MGVVLTDLYHTGEFSINEIVDKMSTSPARIMDLDAGSLKVGRNADITILDLDREWTVDSE